MASLMPPSLLFTALILVTFAVYRFAKSTRSSRSLPPGPKGVPLLGNVADLPPPGELEYQHWLKHKDLYGPISSLKFLNQTFVILNDAEIAFELLKNRSAKYSSRPHMVFSSDMIGWKSTLAFSPYTSIFKTHRKNIARVAGSNTSILFFDRVQEEESAHFLLNVLAEPDKLFDHVKREAGAVILKTTYGYNVASHGKDYLVDLVGRTMEDFSDCTTPGRWMVDIFPFLRYIPSWMPGSGFKKVAEKMALNLYQTAEQPFQFVKQQMREKKHRSCFLSQAIEQIGSDEAAERIHKWSAASMYIGGADTTVSSMMTFFLVMMLFPDVQKTAQAEIDRVIGNDRLPTSADKGMLPYIDAIIKEVHRWHPVTPMALPHCSTEEDTINGYTIPKGSLLLANTWWFAHDPTVYPEPQIFRPERYIRHPGSEPQPDPRDFTFGYGRRVCPGRYVANNALWITIAQVLSVFEISKPIENGVEVEPEVKFEAGVVSHPLPFRTCIKPRSDKHEQIIRDSEKEYPWEQSDAEALQAIKC